MLCPLSLSLLCCCFSVDKSAGVGMVSLAPVGMLDYFHWGMQFLHRPFFKCIHSSTMLVVYSSSMIQAFPCQFILLISFIVLSSHMASSEQNSTNMGVVPGIALLTTLALLMISVHSSFFSPSPQISSFSHLLQPSPLLPHVIPPHPIGPHPFFSFHPPKYLIQCQHCIMYSHS